MAVAEAQDRPQTAVASDGMAYVDGDYVPIGEAKISILDWGFTHSDVTYDVAHVWHGAVFRLEDHLDRFTASMAGLRLDPGLSRDEIREILLTCVRRTGLRDAYLAMLCTRGVLAPGQPRDPRILRNRFFAYAVPWVWVLSPEQQARGGHLKIASTPRIPSDCVDPTIKNYHWGDLTQGLLEAQDAGYDTAILLDLDGNITEGPGFNVFAVIDGTVISPDRGALEGITRKSVFEACDDLGIPHRVACITKAELLDADEVFTSTTAGGVMPVSRVDDRIYGNDRPGPISLRIQERYWALHEEGRHATPVDYG